MAGPEERDRVKASYEDRVRTLSDAVAERERELAILAAVASRVHGENEVQAILDIALDEILQRTGLQTAWDLHGHGRRAEAAPRRLARRGAALPGRRRAEGLGECLCPEVFWSGHRMQARNTTQCPRMPDIIEGLRAPVAHACIRCGSARRRAACSTWPRARGSSSPKTSCASWRRSDIRSGLAGRAGPPSRRRARSQPGSARDGGGEQGHRRDPRTSKPCSGPVTETARELVGADRVVVLLGGTPESLRVGYVAGQAHPEFVVGRTLDLITAGSRLVAAALADRQVYNVGDWGSDPRANPALAERWGIRSGLIVPLIARERVLGPLLLSCADDHRWTEDAVDVAEALAAQASIAVENARLFQEARQAYQELREAQERSLRSEKMAVLGTFASGLAHEVRNPLNSIGLQLSILDRRIGRCEPALGKEMAELSGIIREEVKRLDGLVGDFLLFSRADRIQYHEADLEQLIDEVVHLLRPEARAAGVTIRRQRAGDPIPPARMDGEKMKQVVMNLLRNAVEAMPDGGVVTLESGLVDGRARLVVSDTGPGLPRAWTSSSSSSPPSPRAPGSGSPSSSRSCSSTAATSSPPPASRARARASR
jgi:signal transduction histidine kinase